MSKLIFALHGSDLGPRLHYPAFRQRLRAAGVRRLQVNLDDADVAEASLRFGPGTPIRAVVSVWTDGPATDVVTAVREVDDTADGWAVDEREPVGECPRRHAPTLARLPGRVEGDGHPRRTCLGSRTSSSSTSPTSSTSAIPSTP